MNYHCNDTKNILFSTNIINSIYIEEKEKENSEINSIIIKENNLITKINISNELYLNIINNIIKNFKESNFDKSTTYADEKLELTFALTTTLSQKDSKSINNITTIDLGENHIPINDSLYILMINALLLKEKIQKVEYEVYYSFNEINLTKLNLSICKDIKIEISIPKNISINEIDKYNLSSNLYNDICYTLENEDGTDEPIKVRRKESTDNNIFICEENCDFNKYDNINKKAICSCYTKISLPLVSDIKIVNSQI